MAPAKLRCRKVVVCDGIPAESHGGLLLLEWTYFVKAGPRRLFLEPTETIRQV